VHSAAGGAGHAHIALSSAVFLIASNSYKLRKDALGHPGRTSGAGPEIPLSTKHTTARPFSYWRLTSFEIHQPAGDISPSKRREEVAA
jgi:hypothetical protein